MGVHNFINPIKTNILKLHINIINIENSDNKINKRKEMSRNNKKENNKKEADRFSIHALRGQSRTNEQIVCTTSKKPIIKNSNGIDREKIATLWLH